MRIIIKKTFFVWIVAVCSSIILHAATVYPQSDDISHNLDLNAVASIFGESLDLEDFEGRLNDPSLQISNLDLNNDGQVDYLRIVESYEGNLRLVVIQAVIGRNQYQDVATIEASRRSNSNTVIQIIGDPYLYGPGYIIEPVYVSRPPIYTYFWASVATSRFYHVYHSPYYWGYYPPHYHHWRPRPIPYYRHHVHKHINRHHRYHRTRVRRADTVHLRRKVSKRDYAHKFPDRAFSKRPTVRPRAVKKRKPHLKSTVRSRDGVYSRYSVKPRSAVQQRPVKKQKPHLKPMVRSRPGVYAGHSVKPRSAVRLRPVKKQKPYSRSTVRSHQSFNKSKKESVRSREKSVSDKKYKHR